jgi:saccharopine dehydrogenase-like NADP-dependent oxidoreductase
VISRGKKQGSTQKLEYVLVDYYDRKNQLTAMMRTTGFPVSITAQMIESGLITERGVFGSEELVPVEPFIRELEKRGIQFNKYVK